MGNTVKIDNLAIFKATVEANALDVLYDANTDKVASASIGTLAEGAKTGPAVKAIKLLAQSTGDFTREELKKDAKLSWTDKTKAEIAEAKNSANGNGGGQTGSDTGNGGSQNQGDSQNQQGDSQNQGGTQTGSDTGGGSQNQGGTNSGSDGGGDDYDPNGN